MVQHAVIVAMGLVWMGPEEDDKLAALALIASLRKRSCNLPSEVAADDRCRDLCMNIAANNAVKDILLACEDFAPCVAGALHGTCAVEGEAKLDSTSLTNAAAAAVVTAEPCLSSEEDAGREQELMCPRNLMIVEMCHAVGQACLWASEALSNPGAAGARGCSQAGGRQPLVPRRCRMADR
ncbi:hypothetical protein WJX81_002236 [Elliptochloris bilobata]|uniref:Uncharacterized protein n=1 Tax=Elliptochloris bilobata TaxID=381761 RepID=A0AAW1SDW4_9CHLO